MRESKSSATCPLPPLPTGDATFNEDMVWGEGRGEGFRASDVAPSPPPSPPQGISTESHVIRGGEGAGTGRCDFADELTPAEVLASRVAAELTSGSSYFTVTEATTCHGAGGLIARNPPPHWIT